MGEHFRQAAIAPSYGGKWHLYGKQNGVVRLRSHLSETALGARMTRTPHRSAATGSPIPPNPFLMVPLSWNPHDICHWFATTKAPAPTPTYPFPPAPANKAADHLEPALMLHHRTSGYTS